MLGGSTEENRMNGSGFAAIASGPPSLFTARLNSRSFRTRRAARPSPSTDDARVDSLSDNMSSFNGLRNAPKASSQGSGSLSPRSVKSTDMTNCTTGTPPGLGPQFPDRSCSHWALATQCRRPCAGRRNRGPRSGAVATGHWQRSAAAPRRDPVTELEAAKQRNSD